MPQYMLSVHTSDGGGRRPMTDEEQREGFAKVSGLEADLEAAGGLVISARLTEPTEARVVRSAGGRVRTTDGPFAETKEHLGGFYLIDSANLETALSWAARVSDAIDQPIEVRPLAGSRQPG